jgi:peptidoglycan lytic transglycosylase
VSPGLYVLLVCWVSAGIRAEPGLASTPVRQDPAYEVLLEAASTWDSGGITAFRSALAGRKSDPAAAVRDFDRAAGLLPGLADWANLLAADAAARAGDTTGVRLRLSRVEPGLSRDREWRITALGRRTARDVPGAIVAVESAVPGLSGDRLAQANLLLGELRMSQGELEPARQAFRASINASPESNSALDAATLLSGMNGITADDALLTGRLFFRRSLGAKGLAGFNRYLAASGVTGDRRLTVELEAARGLYDSRRYTAAEPKLSALSRQAPVAGDALAILGRLQIRRGRKDEARQTLRSAIDREPSPERLAEALFSLADLEHDRGSTGTAETLYRRLVSDYASSDQAAEAAMRLGTLDYAAGRYAEAAQVFDQFLTAASGSRLLQSGFWSGQAWLQAGDTVSARARLAAVIATDPASYYGLRASESLGQRWRSSLPAGPPPDDRQSRLAEAAVRRIALLDESGLSAEATAEIERAKSWFRASPGGLYSLGEAFHGESRTLDAVRLGREIQRTTGSTDVRMLRIIYPLRFQKEILAAARQRGIDPYLVAGLIRQESLFDAKARSAAGAIGLMQILPPTGRELARRDGLSGFATSMLRDPGVNIRLGTLFFADLLARNGQTPAYALAAYNAGPSRVVQWRRNPEAADPDLFAERIPFAETRDYVRIVQQNARIYAALYGTQDENEPNDRH